MQLIVEATITSHIFVAIKKVIYQFQLRSWKEPVLIRSFEAEGLIGDFAVVSVQLDSKEEHIYAIFSNKYLCSWNIATGTLAGKKILKKKPTALITPSHKEHTAALISDKAGDIWGYDGPNFQKEELLAGHTASVVTDMIYLSEPPLVITADRDEKIRLSSFPDLETIRSYLLSHTGVISSVAIIKGGAENRPYLVSTGWDHKLVLWDLSTAAVLQELTLSSATSLPSKPENNEEGTNDGKAETATEEKETEEIERREGAGDGEEGGGGGEGDEEENDLKYAESEYGHYPIKIVSIQNYLAVIYKEEKKVDVYRLAPETLTLSLHDSIALPAVPVDLILLSTSHLLILLPQPEVVLFHGIFPSPHINPAIGPLTEGIKAVIAPAIDETWSQSFYISLLGYDGDRRSGMKKHALDRPFNKEETINYEAKRGSKRSRKN